MVMQSQEEKDDLFKELYDGKSTETDEVKEGEEKEEKEEKETPSEETVTSTETEETKETVTDTEKSDTEEAEAKAKAEAEKEVKAEVDEEKEKKKGDVKIALREARGMLRDYKKTKEEEVYKLKTEIDFLKTQYVPKVEDLSHLSEEEKSLHLKLQEQDKKLNELDKWRKEKEINDSELQRQDTLRNIMTEIGDTAKELTDEGYPGFDKFYPLISEKINAMPVEEREEMDTREGWKELYRNSFSTIKSTFENIDKETKFAKKNEDKKKLATLGETKGAIKKESKPYTVDDYFKLRGAKVS